MTSTEYNVAQLLVVGLIFHLVFIASVFDCYFTSPVVHGMNSYGGEASAKRLVLIVGDGLRADLLFNINAFPEVPGSPEIVAPYLRSVVETRGAFGISHTRVPTESRPGHVAIIGGMYEDVSAVTKGWKSNPVDFDSVFNQSSTTFSFGSPDILPMFARGAVPGRVKTWSYDEDEEDFTKDATALDVWVLDQLKTLLRNATTDVTLNNQLRTDKVIFFLHLLGLDTTGHSYRPHSKEYMENIQVVDNIVQETEKLISEFYKDQDTSYIFTADHGMSAIGNHGDGHPDNTRTPIIAWGSGIRPPLPDIHPSSHDAYSEPWQLKHLFRRDMEQADIASLMAALIGINWPVNSVGVLPDVDPMLPGYLSPKNGDEGVAQAAFTNAKVILEQYRVKHELKQKHQYFYTPFTPLAGTSPLGNVRQITAIERLIAGKDWILVRQASAELIQKSLQGLHYLQTYDRFLIRGIVIAAYLGWAAYASLYILRPLDTMPVNSGDKSSFIRVASYTVLVAFWVLLAVQSSPWSFYLYTLFPCYFWQQFLIQTSTTLRHHCLTKYPPISYIKFLLQASMVIIALQGMVAGYTHRFIWSIGFILVGLVWPFSWDKEMRSNNTRLMFSWMTSCIVSAIFPLLSVDKKESLATIMLGGIVILVTGLVCLGPVLQRSRGQKIRDSQSFRIILATQMALIVVTMAITASSVRNLQAKQGLPALNQLGGWVVLVVASLIPLVYKSDAQTTPAKLLMYFLGFGPCFVILSISVEGLFYAAYSVTLVAWIEVERAVRSSHAVQVQVPELAKADELHKTPTLPSAVYRFCPDDLRIALFFLFFVQIGFFGTGNVASISSFYLAPVYRLIPIFNPFFMAALLVFKIVAPYIILAVMFAVLNDALHLPPFSLLLVALTITDGMTLTFFFKVQDTGSWLEIGQSISFFCITSLLLLWSAGICAAGEYLMADVQRVNKTTLDKYD
ncbi:Phosphatidylinositolglycan class N-domain-containing protein [Crassisporium funariophilum]|nr:Phosphatidylinositolglycan class N-domain-containing protein [Crassisporium funariophilum]